MLFKIIPQESDLQPFELNIDKHISIHELKKMIKDKLNLPYFDFRLKFVEKDFQDESLLSDYFNHDRKDIFLYLGPNQIQVVLKNN